MRSRMESGTLGRPSGTRSPFQSGVYLMTSSRVKNPCCATAAGATEAATATNTTALSNVLPKPFPKRLPKQFIICFLCSLTSCVRFKPGCTGNLRPSCDFFVHFHTDARSIGHRDVALFDDLAFLHPSLPIGLAADPVPLACQEVWNTRADVCRRHGADRRHNTMRRERNIVGLRQVRNLARLG